MKSLFFLQQPVSHKAAEEFVKLDPYGIGMTLVAMTVVFLSLLILYITFKNIAKLFAYDFKAKPKKSDETNVQSISKKEQTVELGAAIAMALHLYQRNISLRQ